MLESESLLRATQSFSHRLLCQLFRSLSSNTMAIQVPHDARILLSTIYLNEVAILAFYLCQNMGHYLPW